VPRAALARVVAAYAVQAGLQVPEDLVFTVLGVGAVLIGGIAREDHVTKPPISRRDGVNDARGAVFPLGHC
jgi:hypothetical protein